jgi:Leucine-rich repeat (LRR) protein
MNTSAGCGTTSAAVARVTMSASVAPEERRMTSARMPSTGAERSEMLQPKRLQPRADMNEQLHSTRRFIPTDLVQNTAEYLGRVNGFLSFRGVSTEWQGAVSDAVGFLNGRSWDRLGYRKMHSSSVDRGELWTRLRIDDAAVVARCAVLCLRSRLAALSYVGVGCVPLRLLGDTNETLVTLSVHGALPVHRLSCLLGCVALRELSLQSTWVTNEDFARLGPLLARLHKLDLSECKQLKAISNFAPATSLRELNLAHCGNLTDLQSLDKLVALKTLDVTGISTVHLSILRQCPRLVTLTAKGDIIAFESIIHAAPPSLVDCRLYIDDAVVSALDSRSLSCLRRSTVLTFNDLDNASLQGLEEIPSLELLDLAHTRVDDVRSLAGCPALKKLMLQDSVVTDVGIIGLERIATLEVLNLTRCRHITSVSRLRHCTTLRELFLGGTSVTDAGIAGLECIVTLTKLNLACTKITSVSSLRHSPSLRDLDFSATRSLAAGTEGLDEIGTLQRLKASEWAQLDASTLRRCRSLREVDLSHSDVPDAVLVALADVSTLETLTLSDCHRLRDVSALASSVSLRVLDLCSSAVSDAGIAGLERIPSLTWLSLSSCGSITNVTNLFRSKSLRKLVLSGSHITDVGLVGLHLAPALEFVDMRNCNCVYDIFDVVWRAAEQSVTMDRDDYGYRYSCGYGNFSDDDGYGDDQ